MKPTFYIELPTEKILYLQRPDFKEGGAEHKFYQMLKTSMNKQGMKDPIFAYENADGTIKTIVGNNRMWIANKLGIKTIRCIITVLKPETSSLKGKLLKTDEEIKDLFFLPETVEVRRHKEGWVDQVNSRMYRQRYWKLYV